MHSKLKPFDCNGNEISVDDKVIYLEITEYLLKDLPSEDQKAIKAQKGEILKVISFDKNGYAELEFKHEGHLHTIWVEPSCLGKFTKKAMETRKIKTPLTEDIITSLHAGDMVLLSGEIYTARDVAHRRLYESLLKGEKLPVDLSQVVLFYAAPTPTPPKKIVGSIGPTTSYRMDFFTPALIEAGLRAMIGKGNRSAEVVKSIQAHKAVYFGAIGGIAALMSQCVKKVELIAYEDLGPEAIRKMTVMDLPLVIINDSEGNDLYFSQRQKWRI